MLLSVLLLPLALLYHNHSYANLLMHRFISLVGCLGRKTMYYVYVLKSYKNGKLYKGSTADLKKRFVEHIKGRRD
ncbi:MAG TPA: GIY-YIG nuclease family protein [Candidatus Paceibacterota bacterium]